MRITPRMIVDALTGRTNEHLGGAGYLHHRGDGEYVIDATVDMPAVAGRLNEMIHEQEEKRRKSTPSPALQPEEPCPFCEIIAGRADAEVVYADDVVVIFTPLNPVTPGHVLVVPCRHVEDFSTNPTLTGEVMRYAARYARWRDQGPMNLITSKGEEATQSVSHLHAHLVPRREGDDLALPWTGQPEASEAERVLSQVRALAAEYRRVARAPLPYTQEAALIERLEGLVQTSTNQD